MGARLRAELARLEALEPHDVLNVVADAPLQEVRQAFLAKTKIFHPNRFALESSEIRDLANEIFLVIRKAYEQLQNPQKRLAQQPVPAPAVERVERVEREKVRTNPPGRTPQVSPGGRTTGTQPSGRIPGTNPSSRAPSTGRPVGTSRPVSSTPVEGVPIPPAAARPAVTPQPAAPREPTAAPRGPLVPPMTGPPPPRTPSAVSFTQGGPPTPPTRPAGAPTRPVTPVPGRPPEEVQAMLELVRTRNARYEEALKLLDTGEWSKAREMLHQIAAEDPHSKRYRARLAFALAMEYRAAGDKPSALRELERALALEPEYDDAQAALRKLHDDKKGGGGLLSKLFGR